MSANTGTRYVIEAVSAAEEVPRVRREAAEVLSAWGIGAEASGTVCLIVTELFGNVVRHAAVLSPTATITLQLEADRLTVGVADAHPVRPRALAVPHENGGRGLYLVKALVEEAGGSHDVFAAPAGGGKEIVITLPLAVPVS